MKYSHDGLIYNYILLLLHLSCWYYLTVTLLKRNFLFSEFEEISGGFLENLHFLKRFEEKFQISGDLRRRGNLDRNNKTEEGCVRSFRKFLSGFWYTDIDIY